jgi:hypothetical protein
MPDNISVVAEAADIQVDLDHTAKKKSHSLVGKFMRKLFR